MTLIEGIGDEVTHFFIGLVIVLIISFAWWTTSISEQRHEQTAWLLFRRRLTAQRRLTNHVTHSSISEGTSTPLNSSSDTGEETLVMTEPAPKPPEPSTSGGSGAASRSVVEEEQLQIVEAMDDDACVLRQRRLAFYERGSPEDASPSEDVAGSYTPSAPPPPSEIPPSAPPQKLNDIRIRLKYINDDQKLVDGRLQERLGDFKKRHFQGEMLSNKLVRLIFNGQVLHQDTKTLEGYGFFDNCVVHCLVHQRRPSPGEEASGDGTTESSGSNHNRNQPPNNNQGRDWDLGNFLFALITFTLLSAWYFRYVYSHLYTVTATVGLIMMTGVFSILLFGFYFPDQDPPPQQQPHQQTGSNQS